MLFVVSGCSQPKVCDASEAAQRAREAVASMDKDKSLTATRVTDKGKSWLVDVFDPDAGVGGHIIARVTKDSCDVQDIDGHQ